MLFCLFCNEKYSRGTCIRATWLQYFLCGFSHYFFNFFVLFFNFPTLYFPTISFSMTVVKVFTIYIAQIWFWKSILRRTCRVKIGNYQYRIEQGVGGYPTPFWNSFRTFTFEDSFTKSYCRSVFTSTNVVQKKECGSWKHFKNEEGTCEISGFLKKWQNLAKFEIQGNLLQKTCFWSMLDWFWGFSTLKRFIDLKVYLNLRGVCLVQPKQFLYAFFVHQRNLNGFWNNFIKKNCYF